MKKDKVYYFKDAPVINSILFFTIPSILSQIATLLYNWADTFFIGQLSNSYLISSVSICHPAYMLTSSIANLFGIGGASVISRALGENNEEKIKKVSTLSILLAVLTSIIYSILLFIFKDNILFLCGATTNTINYAKEYLTWAVIYGSLPSVLSFTLSHLIRSIGKTKISSTGIIIGAICNIIFDPIFIYVFKMNVVGAAIATTLSNIISTLFFITYLFITRKNHQICFSLKKLKLKELVFKEIVFSGLSSSCLTLMAIFSNISINKLTSLYGDYATSGVSIAKKIDLLILSLTQGLTHGILPLIAYNHSSRNIIRRNKIIKFASIIGLSISTLFVFIAFPFSNQLISIFTNHKETIEYGSKFLKILCLSMPLTCLVFIFNTIFQATKETKKALAITLLRKGTIDIPLMIILNNTFLGLYGIILSQPIIDIFSVTMAIPLFISFIKKEKNNMTLKN